MKRVLIVEPCAQTQALARAALRSAGTDVVAVADGPAARALLHGPLRFDLVVAAADLPDEAPCALLADRQPTQPPTPWLLLCREESVRSKIRALELGAEGVLTPPIYWREFAALAQRLLKEGAAGAVPKRRYQGVVSTGVLRDILRHALEDGREGRLEAEGEDGPNGQVLFSQGTVVAARVGAVSGEMALRRLVGWKAGRFTLLYEPVAVATSPLTTTCLEEGPTMAPPTTTGARRTVQIARRPSAPSIRWPVWMGGLVTGLGLVAGVVWWILDG